MTAPLATLDQPGAADPARQRLARKSRFPIFSSLPNLKAKSKQKDIPSASVSTDQLNLDQVDAASIRLSIIPVALPDDDHYRDKYQWAVLYENQRGLTLFSVPYYSSNSLLPSDPPPFTLPSATSLKRSHQPYVSLKEYPLPDGNWHWVTSAWMIDMRSDSGQVQHDGFEYNWMFRKHHWHAQVGPFSAGGWVRRRRWIRLMMRPGLKRRHKEDESMNDAVSPGTAASSFRNSWNGWGTGHPFPLTPSVRSPSVYAGATGFHQSLNIAELWRGDVDEDWKLCRDLMRMAGSDGAKLEMWKGWLGLDDKTHDEVSKADDIGNDERSLEATSAPPLEYVTAVLCVWLPVILKESLTFPESRRQLVELLSKANVLSQLPVSESVSSTLEFWSLNNEVTLD